MYCKENIGIQYIFSPLLQLSFRSFTSECVRFVILVVNLIDSLTHLSRMTNLDQLSKSVSNFRVVALLGIVLVLVPLGVGVKHSDVQDTS